MRSAWRALFSNESASSMKRHYSSRRIYQERFVKLREIFVLDKDYGNCSGIQGFYPGGKDRFDAAGRIPVAQIGLHAPVNDRDKIPVARLGIAAVATVQCSDKGLASPLDARLKCPVTSVAYLVLTDAFECRSCVSHFFLRWGVDLTGGIPAVKRCICRFSCASDAIFLHPPPRPPITYGFRRPVLQWM